MHSETKLPKYELYGGPLDGEVFRAPHAMELGQCLPIGYPPPGVDKQDKKAVAAGTLILIYTLRHTGKLEFTKYG